MIKSASLILAMAAFLPVAANAQTSTSRPLSFGLTAGVTVSDINSSDSTTFKRLVGGVGGVFMGTSINSNLGLLVEVLATQRGAADDLATADVTFRLTYLDVPVLLRFGPTSDSGTNFNVFTGPVAGFRLKADLKDDKTGISLNRKNDTKGLDLGWAAGVGVERGAFLADLRYTMGISDFNDNKPGPKLRNRSAALKVGFRFR